MERFGKTFLGALLCAAAMIPAVAPAAESYDNCTGFIDSLPASISSPGTWCLRKDLGTNIASGVAIVIEASNATLDCNGFKVGGLAAGRGTMATGIQPFAGLKNTTVRNCRVRGFRLGISTEGGAGHLIEDNHLERNREVGINVYSPNSTVRHNMVMDTGGGTATSNGAQGIVVSGGVDVLDNTVVGVASNDLQANNDARGIVAVDNAMGSVVGNRIRGVVPFGAGPAFGILDFTNGYSVIRDNIVQGMGLSGSIGIKCDSASITSRDNVIAGFALGVDGCTSSGDSVNSN